MTIYTSEKDCPGVFRAIRSRRQLRVAVSLLGIERVHHRAIDVIWHHSFFKLPDTVLSHTPPVQMTGNPGSGHVAHLPRECVRLP